MRNIKKILPILILLVILIAVFLTVKLSQQRQEIRKKAASPEVIIFLSPSSDTRTVSETFPVQVKFNSGGQSIMGLGFYITSTSLEIEPLAITNNLAGIGGPPPKIIKQTGFWNIQYQGVFGNDTGFTPTGDTLVATIVFKANSPIQNKQINFDLSQTEIWSRANDNILSSATGGIYTVVSCSTPSLPTINTSLDYGTATCTNDNLPTWQWSTNSPGCTLDNYRIDRDWVTNITGQDYDLETTNNSFTPPSALTTGSYQIKIKAHNARGWSDWSGFSQITLDTSTPNVPSLNTPAADSASPDNTPLLTVNPVADNGCKGEISYAFQIDNNSDFASPEQTSNWTPSLTWEIPTPLANGDYYWRARAKDGFNNTSSWSGGRKLTVNIPVTLNFSLKFQGINRAGSKEIRFSVKNTSFSQTLTVVGDAGGVYRGTITLSPQIIIPPGASPPAYDILIKSPTHLQKKFTKNLIQGTNTADWTAAGSELLAGDVWSQQDNTYHDNKITTEDVISVLNMWTDFTVNVGAGTLQDLNADNKITSDDIRLLLANYKSPTIYGQE